MRLALAALLLLQLSSLAVAAEVCDELPKGTEEIAKVVNKLNKDMCPNPNRVLSICNSIGSRVEDSDPDSYYVYDYQRRIYEASCADPEKDSEAEVSRKVRLMWDRYEKDFKCSSTQFDVPNGSILKLAVKKLFREVLEDAVMVWRVNLNRIDETDNRTVLDYVEKEIELNKGNHLVPKLKEYYKILKDGGAKHRREL